MSESSTDEGSLSHGRVATVEFLDLILSLCQTYPTLAQNLWLYRTNFKQQLAYLYNFVRETPHCIPDFQNESPSDSLVAAPPTPSAPKDDSRPVISDMSPPPPPRPSFPAEDAGHQDNSLDTSASRPLEIPPPIIVEDVEDQDRNQEHFLDTSASPPPRSPSPLGSSILENQDSATASRPPGIHPPSSSAEDVDFYNNLSSDGSSQSVAAALFATSLDTSASQVTGDLSVASPVARSSAVTPEWEASFALSDESMEMNSSFNGSRLFPKTIHEFLLKTNLMPPISSFTMRHISSRCPRGVELLKVGLEQLVYLPSMHKLFMNFLCEIPGERLDTRDLPIELYRLLNAGVLVANCAREVKSEADVEYRVRAFEAHIATQIINFLNGRGNLTDEDRCYARKGTPGSQGGGPSPIADIEYPRSVTEIKTRLSINLEFIYKLLGLDRLSLNALVAAFEDGTGFLFNFAYPQFFRDSLNSTVQPLVQIWAQVNEKGYYFGQGSSHEHAFFAIRDPKNPHRLYISPCYATHFDSHLPEDPAASGLYMMFNVLRVATKDDYAQLFLEKLREDMTLDKKLVAVHCRDISLAGSFNPPSTATATVDVSTGTVGVKYYDQPSKLDVLRERTGTPPVYKDATYSFVEESYIEDEATKLTEARKETAAKKPATSRIPRHPNAKVKANVIARKTLAALAGYLDSEQAAPAASGSGPGEQRHRQRTKPMSKAEIDAAKTSPAMTRSRRLAGTSDTAAATIPSGGGAPPHPAGGSSSPKKAAAKATIAGKDKGKGRAVD
ncbi:hypothetical protein DFH06DRAFT_623658 [Mycena polygramma]|nr:hypothetical protein DFH06DRAFT_623658 [Mycena polygramma]